MGQTLFPVPSIVIVLFFIRKYFVSDITAGAAK